MNADINDLEHGKFVVSVDDPTKIGLIALNPDGSSISGGGIGLSSYDYVSRVLTNSTTETYTFKIGGSSGTTVNTVVIVYTDSTLETISSVTKT